MSGIKELDIDSATDLLNNIPDTTEALTAEVKEHVGSDKEPAGAAEDTTSDEALAVSEDAASNEDSSASEDTQDDQADQGALPIIEPPSSWNAEEKAAFKASPPKAQEAILRREQENSAELRRLQNSTAEQSKASEAEVTRLQGLSAQIESVVNSHVANLSAEFPEIRTENDVVALAQSDPARFAVFQAKLVALNAVQQAQAGAQQEISQRAQVAQRETLTKARDALIEAFPAWKDPTVAQREVTELQDYAIKAYGVSEQAARAELNPTVYKMAQKAMLFDKAQKAKAEALVRTPPRTPLTPNSGGTGTGKVDKTAASKQAAKEKLSKSGDIEDALELLMMR